MNNGNKRHRKQLAGMRILVVEDEYFIADDVRRCLVEAGGEVVGPVATLAQGKGAIAAGGFDCAILDLNLHGESGLVLAEQLERLAIPFTIATGYGSPAVPDRFDRVPRVEKPFDPEVLLPILCGLKARLESPSQKS
jgi:DNA-binding NtrC family response regulator